MKKVICLVIALMLMVGCGGAKVMLENGKPKEVDENSTLISTSETTIESEQPTNPESLTGFIESLSYDDSESVLEQLATEFDESYIRIENDFHSTYSALGSNYSTYMENCSKLESWYESTAIEMSGMYERMEEMLIICARVLARTSVLIDKNKATDSFMEFKASTWDLYEQYYLNVYNNLYETILPIQSECLSGYPEYKEKDELRRSFRKLIDEMRHSSWDRFQNNYKNILKEFNDGKIDIDSVIE